MQLLTEQTTTIARSVDATYLYATNLEHFAEWFPGVLSIESANTLAHAQCGKEYLETMAIPLRGTRKIKISVKDAQSNKVFVTEGDFSPLMPRMEIFFQVTGIDSCSVTWRMSSRNDGWLFKTTLLHVFKRVMQKRAAIGMKRLKRKLEI
ncbi:SRPBCC family protein [Rhodoferax saidenbachensis]|uniref:Polyketide cyclase n=1 Tax=Rhodoferax saidenbachensis TaxID=1484693 RepID=A0ABU1ZQ72_9BURK|nr:SRPBCC family protein [Rhodoferax saidenbachensis]MDR7307694.1 hypothetical protein [Rhodoferax saidenbachensis]